MPVYKGPIRIFTLDKLGSKTVSVIKDRRPAPTKKKKLPKKVTKALPKVAPSASASTQYQKLKPIRVKLRLLLNDKQKEQLEVLFKAHKALAELLKTYPQKLSTPADASVFLLKNRKELDGFINPKARERSVDLLTELLLQSSDSPPDSLGIDFDDVSLTPEQKVYLPINGFRGIEVFEANQLQQQRRGRKFKHPFTLFQEEKNYFVALTLVPKVCVQQSTPASNKPTPIAKNKSSRKSIKESILKSGQPLPYINGMRSQSKKQKEPSRRVLYSKRGSFSKGGFAAMNWGGLSGRGVNGGLPSLGKRSR